MQRLLARLRTALGWEALGLPEAGLRDLAEAARLALLLAGLAAVPLLAAGCWLGPH